MPATEIGRFPRLGYEMHDKCTIIIKGYNKKHFKIYKKIHLAAFFSIFVKLNTQ